MTRFLSFAELVELHRVVIESSGGSKGVRDLGALESAMSQPRAAFGDSELYPSPLEKAAALGFSLCGNHPFVDGNKRIAHAAMEVFLMLNGYEIRASIDDQERLMLGLAEGSISRDELLAWIRAHAQPRSGSSV